MTDDERINEIRERLETGAYLRGLDGQKKLADDAGFLLSLLGKKDEMIRGIERKLNVLQEQNLELTQAIENIKSDFDKFQR